MLSLLLPLLRDSRRSQALVVAVVPLPYIFRHLHFRLRVSAVLAVLWWALLARHRLFYAEVEQLQRSLRALAWGDVAGMESLVGFDGPWIRLQD